MTRLLMVDPAHYDIAYAINPHMRAADGSLQRVDRAKAREQWVALRAAFEGAGCSVETLSATPELPDMVFAANHGLPVGADEIILSNMTHETRRPEVARFAAWYRERGWKVHGGPPGESFEGMGDCIWSADARTLFAGFGFRTSRSAIDWLERRLGLEIVRLPLVDARFYHLDTAFAAINADCAAVVREALAPEAMKELARKFRRLIEVPIAEAERCLAANLFSPDGHRAVVQRGAQETCRRLRDAGIEPVEVETGEFLKAGGSVFCLKMALDRPGLR